METPPSAAAIDSRNLEISSFDLAGGPLRAQSWCGSDEIQASIYGTQMPMAAADPRTWLVTASLDGVTWRTRDVDFPEIFGAASVVSQHVRA